MDCRDFSEALLEPQSIVITRELAQRIFGKDDPRGEVLYEVDETLYTVTGVLEDIPENSHLQFDALISISSLEERPWMFEWSSNWMNTYVLLSEGASVPSMTARFPEFLESKREGITEEYEMYLQPLKDIHLGSSIITHDYNNYQKFDRTYVNVFGMLAVFVLLLAVINFTNLSTARSSTRSRIRRRAESRRAWSARLHWRESSSSSTARSTTTPPACDRSRCRRSRARRSATDPVPPPPRRRSGPAGCAPG